MPGRIPRRLGIVTAALGIAVVTGFGSVATAQSQNQLSLGQRVQRLERIVNGPGLVDLLSQVQTLQQQVQQINGRQEELGHQLDDLQRRQRDLYLDIDRRLRQLEVKAGVVAPGSTLVPGPGTASGAAVGAAGAAGAAGAVGAVGATGATGATGAVGATGATGTASGTTSVPGTAAAAPQATSAVSAGSDGVATLQMQSQYENALALLREGKYPEADQAFRAFLAAHPDSSYADNAEYWLGEANYVRGRYDPALQAFRKVAQRYPKSPKVPDALLKVGYIQYDLKQWKEAREVLTGIRSRYPDSTAARLAGQRLERMRQEGH
ncbi:MAG: tol-pal system protein YbgF [Chromatiales bacterium 21-64-14]|nr:MAG: tol-pal system protein YbgF [Chromatiales bacterium 21-64-14]